MNFAIAIIYLMAAPWAMGEKIHERMTASQVSAIFNKPHHDLVPEYDVVRLHMPKRNKRDVGAPQKLIAKALGNEASVYLWTDNSALATKNTKVYTAFGNRRNTYFNIIPDAMKKVGELWEDPVNHASLIVKRDIRGKYIFDGYIGSENMVVRSLPDSISEHLEQNNGDSESPEHSAYHIIYKDEEKDRLEHALKERSLQSYFHGPTYDNNEVLFPELMIVVDYESYKQQGENDNRTLAYILAFWNQVDILYRKFDRPQVRLTISQVVITKSSRALPFIVDNQLDDNLLSNNALHDAGRFFYSRTDVFPINSYDAIIIMSGQNWNDGSIGLAFLGGMCKVYDRQETLRKVALTRNNGYFGFIMTAAHELGHLFNMDHDEPDDTICPHRLGYIMASGRPFTEHNFDFSQCSIEEFSTFIDNQEVNCTKNIPSFMGAISRIMPAQLLTREKQCEKLSYGKNCFSLALGHNACNRIYCQEENFPCQEYRVYPPEGSLCGKDKICVHGSCLNAPPIYHV